MAPPTAIVATPLLAATSSIRYPVDHRGVKHLLDSNPDLRTLPPPFIRRDHHLLLTPSASSTASSLQNELFPIVDVSLLNNPATRADTVRSIASAASRGGYFLALNHPIPSSTITSLLSSARQFFSLPIDDKLAYASDDPAAPVRYGSSINTSEPQPQLFWRDFLRHVGADSHLWPTNPPSYAPLAQAMLQGCRDLASLVAAAASEGLLLGDDVGPGTVVYQGLVCNYYPRCPQPELAMGLGAHTDKAAVVVLADNGVEGLQVRAEGGEWVPVPRGINGAVVVMFGEHLAEMSGGKVKAAEHRVVTNGDADRISITVGNCQKLASRAQWSLLTT